jgi:UDP-N-acetylglucosamine 2-epimerase (non-hydrolysing)
MTKLKVMVVLGTRPEAIKLAPVIRSLRAEAEVHTDLVLSGQHRDLVTPILEFFQLTADRDLDVMAPAQTLAGLTARAVLRLDAALAEIQPDWVIVQGDTTTAMAAALAAFYRGVAVAHLEAGLRTNKLNSPFPEEVNRRIIGQVAALNWSPTRHAADALRREGLPLHPGRVVVTGNTVIDALLEAVARVRENPPGDTDLKRAAEHQRANPAHAIVLITGHRRENFGEPFREFCSAIRDAALAHPEALFIYPVHPNPNVRAPVEEMLHGQSNILLTQPKAYPSFVALLDLSDIVLTDSGGVQEEAPALGKPVLVTRHDTERPEGIATGHVKLIGPDRDAIVREIAVLMQRHRNHTLRLSPAFPYGDGHASRRCVDSLLNRVATEFGA